MIIKQLAAVGVLAVTLVGGGATSALAATTSTTASGPTAPTAAPGTATERPAKCLPSGHDDAWPGWANGRPDRDPGVRVWHDGSGWHVRVTHDTVHDRVFEGEIYTTGTLVGVHAVRTEKNDSLVVGAGGHTIRFRFNNYGGTDGFDFATHCAPFLALGFLSDGHVVPTARIAIGAGSRHPGSDPFLIVRPA